MIEQGTPEWFAQRCGKVTASRVADVIAKTKSGYAASRKNYMAQLVAERLTQTVSDSYSNAAMQWGIETEPQARAAYSLFHAGNMEVTEAEFVVHPVMDFAGASPDGYVGKSGLVEIKCPNTATHIDTLLSGKIPAKYITQMQWQMACTSRGWCDFVSFDPRLPDYLSTFVSRVEWNPETTKKLEAEVSAFNQEICATLNALNKLEKAA